MREAFEEEKDRHTLALTMPLKMLMFSLIPLLALWPAVEDSWGALKIAARVASRGAGLYKIAETCSDASVSAW